MTVAAVQSASSKWPTLILRALLVPLALPVLWGRSAEPGRLPPQILPSPAEVGATFLDMAKSGDLWRNTSVSLLRVREGFAVGGVIGLLLGVTMGLSRALEAHVRPLFTGFAQVPTLGWIPFLMMLVGIGEPLKILVIAKAAFVPMRLNTLAGVRNVPVVYAEVGALFRFTRWQMLRQSYLPAAVPPIFTGLRYGLTHAWFALVAVELLASSEGLGYRLVWSRQMFWLDTVMVAMVMIGSVGFILDRIMAEPEHRLQSRRVADTVERRA